MCTIYMALSGMFFLSEYSKPMYPVLVVMKMETSSKKRLYICVKFDVFNLDWCVNIIKPLVK
jgi:hypothetical protein